LWFDSLSANPLGISILPLFAVGFIIHLWRDLFYATNPSRKWCWGSPRVPRCRCLNCSCCSPPEASTAGHWHVVAIARHDHRQRPWQHPWFLSIGLGPKNPGSFTVVETSFRPDREIRRGDERPFF
jgi:hypothetical protein